LDRSTAVLVTAVVGGLLALQAPINSNLSDSTGNIPSALISFLVGTIILAAIVVVSGKAGSVGEVTTVPWYYLVGGALGAIYVTVALATVSTIGAGGVAAATIAGQLTASVVIDQIGAFGLDQEPITLSRVIGVVLLLGGMVLIVR
jgi:bacterial/archaeal transporter family-2 protein